MKNRKVCGCDASSQNLIGIFPLVCFLTKEGVEQSEEAEGDGDGQLGVDGETQNDGD